MNKMIDLLQFILFSQLIDDFGKEVYKLLNEKGFSNEDIKILDKYSSLYLWVLVMNDYICGKNSIDGYELYTLTLYILDKSLSNIDDYDLATSMQEFLNHQTIEKATEIINKIQNKTPIDVLKDLFERTIKTVQNEKIGYSKE